MRLNLRTAAATLAIAFFATLALSVTGAGAQSSDDTYVGGEVRSETVIRPSAPEVASANLRSGSLAFTGGDAMTIALVGVVAVVAGTSLLIVRRRTHTV